MRVNLRKPDEIFLIWSYEHTAWWRPNSAGYTEDPMEAGTYRKEKAQEIINQSLGNEVMLPANAIFQLLSAYTNCFAKELLNKEIKL